jgi:hypothetical protein
MCKEVDGLQREQVQIGGADQFRRRDFTEDIIAGRGVDVKHSTIALGRRLCAHAERTDSAGNACSESGGGVWTKLISVWQTGGTVYIAPSIRPGTRLSFCCRPIAIYCGRRRSAARASRNERAPAGD